MRLQFKPAKGCGNCNSNKSYISCIPYSLDMTQCPCMDCIIKPMCDDTCEKYDKYYCNCEDSYIARFPHTEFIDYKNINKPIYEYIHAIDHTKGPAYYYPYEGNRYKFKVAKFVRRIKYDNFIMYEYKIKCSTFYTKQIVMHKAKKVNMSAYIKAKKHMQKRLRKIRKLSAGWTVSPSVYTYEIDLTFNVPAIAEQVQVDLSLLNNNKTHDDQFNSQTIMPDMMCSLNNIQHKQNELIKLKVLKNRCTQYSKYQLK